MRTIAELKAELERFPDDAYCMAYEGEGVGLIIEMHYKGTRRAGWISCSGQDEQSVTETLKGVPFP